MKDVQVQALRARARGNKVKDNVLRRLLYDVVNKFSAGSQPVFHDFMHKVLTEASSYKLSARQNQFVHLVCDSIRYGWSIFVSNGKWQLCTLPNWSNRAWKIIVRRGMEQGAEIARKQLLSQTR